ncbi:hypothetical protein BIY24_03815 [Halobacteriovorax marinus]|uniref:hypothetical protein n=1 Tax=Halobacteriovorax marinus TaxID=97084 RepID=UPI000BC31AF4|nr:hypothetical protein [Halobacteriovorax marinus]ATH07093.1 hypothetical protein BIY24_03815 [Halobacteriovorax marinus]
MTATIWQIAAGDPGRYATKIFLDYDLMFLGPGDPGDILLNSDTYKDIGISAQKLRALQRFANTQEVKAGDIVLLRETYRVVAIGVVSEDEYRWNPCLDDVYGWDLQHTRRVIWQEELNKELLKIQDETCDLFSGRKQTPMFTRVSDEKIIDKIDHLVSKIKTRKLKSDLNGIQNPMNLKELESELYGEGLSQGKISQLINVIEDQRRLIKWYGKNGFASKRPTEHEIVAFMIIPLLQSLGWSKQLLGVEWHKVDLAGFHSVPSNEDNCVFVCEAKSLGTGMNHVFFQAEKYVNSLNLTKCSKIITTDGPTIYVYEKQDGVWNHEPSGYVNLSKLRREHLVPPNTDGVKTLMSLAPEGMHKKLKD